MPTYSYACTECGDRFDAVQAFTDDALTTCEKCSGRLRKLFNSVGVVFKGSGFYRTDSRADGKKSKSSTNGSSVDAGSSSGSSEKTGSSDKGASGDKSGSSDKSTSSATPATAAASS
ncbi:FmdB family transcriptional regulator [Mycobacterium sp. 852002-50816_SCH5313054-b]|uniref:FmdB family zinc ribbon protein n=1 Tax=Mycobacterium sp. 852002-50816_SCH5313054-b TaxID=1834092 RepID=UPI0007FC474B|nr:FmdB family zinc ribbon protein [Mycobacterium sp. 852002-50816_SCH5313054-b]OBF61121.1 FmdB family transcriptional regulator [Mycobacterium sp. 852002-50816_SCH5313054-b]